LVQIRDPDASVTPDGGAIAYMWLGNVYIQLLPAGAPVRVANVVGGRSVYPRWRGDGNELYYLDGHKVMAVSIRREPRLEVGTAAALFDLPENCGAYAPAPDGQRFLVEIPTNPPKPPGTLHVLLNWRSSRH
jgi:hypothetical protein